MSTERKKGISIRKKKLEKFLSKGPGDEFLLVKEEGRGGLFRRGKRSTSRRREGTVTRRYHLIQTYTRKG